MKKFSLLAILVMVSVLVSCRQEKKVMLPEDIKFVVQVRTGGEDTAVTAEKVIGRLEEVAEEVPVGTVVVDGDLDAELYGKVGEYLHSKDIPMFVWIPLSSETEVYCPSSSESLIAVKDMYRDHFAGCGFDGVFLDRFCSRAEETCRCELCGKYYQRHGVDFDAVGAGDKSAVSVFLKAKAELIAMSVGILEDWFHLQGVRVAVGMFEPGLAAKAGQDYEALSDKADFVVPAVVDFSGSSMDTGSLLEILQEAQDVSECPVYPGIELIVR